MILFSSILSIFFSVIYIFSKSTPKTLESEIMEFFYGIALSMIAAAIFYFIQVVIPERKRKKVLKGNFKLNYKLFKEQCIYIFLFASGISSVSPDLVEKLLDINEFNNYFKGGKKANEGWYAVLNGLNDQNLKEIMIQFEILSQEIEFILNNISLHDEEIFRFFKQLKYELYLFKNTTPDYDEIKNISRFLWEIFAGWTYVNGQRKKDIFEEMVSKI